MVPSTWATLHGSPRLISRMMNQKQSRQDSNWCPGMGCHHHKWQLNLHRNLSPVQLVFYYFFSFVVVKILRCRCDTYRGPAMKPHTAKEVIQSKGRSGQLAFLIPSIVDALLQSRLCPCIAKLPIPIASLGFHVYHCWRT